jgi:putrescine transport system permease protein
LAITCFVARARHADRHLGNAGAHAMTRPRFPLSAVAPTSWLAIFFLAPFLIVLRLSLSDTALALPPYRPVFEGFERIGEFLSALDLENFRLLLSDDLYVAAFLSSLRIAGIATALTLAIGYPLALAITRAPKGWQPLLLTLIIIPFWTSFLIRVYAWSGILRNEGVLDQTLGGLGLTSGPLDILPSEAAVILGIVYCYLPFMVLPVWASLTKIDPRLSEAAADLGATPWRVLATITWPLSLPGVLAGSLLVFIPAVGEVVVPDLLGGPDTLMIGRVLWTEFFGNRDWPVAAAIAVVLVVVVVLPLALLERRVARGRRT